MRNPYNGAVVGTVPAARPEQVREAFAKAQGLQAEAHALRAPADPAAHRRDCCADRKEEFARLITAESGLCLKDSLYEVGRAYDVYSFAGQLAIKDDGEIYSCDITPARQAAQDLHHAQAAAAACISAITPFNHPLNMVAHKLAPAIATNNRVVLKPTELTPLTALRARRRALRGGPAARDAVGRHRQSVDDGRRHDHRPGRRPRHLHGPVQVGKYIADKAGYKRIVLELGGNDPLIVMEDADLDKAAELAVQGATKNSGQRCTAVKRILVVEKRRRRVRRAACSRRRKKLKAGDPMDPATDVGTVIHERAATLFEAASTMRSRKGAKLLHGNDRAGRALSADRGRPRAATTASWCARRRSAR